MSSAGGEGRASLRNGNEGNVNGKLAGDTLEIGDWGLGAGDDLTWHGMAVLDPSQAYSTMDSKTKSRMKERRPSLRSDSKNSLNALHTSIASATSLRSINVMHCHLNEASVRAGVSIRKGMPWLYVR